MKRTAAVVIALGLGLAAARATPAQEASPPARPPEQLDWGKVPEYRIVPGDELRFNFGPGVGGSVDVLRDGIVRPDGRVSVFPVGDLIAAGRTPAEIQADLLGLLSAEYKQPRVTVEVIKLAGNMVHVLGRVKRPGSQPLAPMGTLLQALAEAGGFEDDAARSNVLILHRDGSTGVRVARIRADRLLKGAGDVLLSRFDIVYVPRSAIGNLNLFVRQFFSEQVGALNFALVGWELFNLDRVFLVRASQAQ